MRPRIRELSSMCLPFALRAQNPIKFGTSSTGQLVEPAGGKYLDNIEPATGKAYSQVADSDARDVDLAVTAAEKEVRGLVPPERDGAVTHSPAHRRPIRQTGAWHKRLPKL